MRFVQEYSQDPRSGVVLVNTAEMLLKTKYPASTEHRALGRQNRAGFKPALPLWRGLGARSFCF